MNAFTYYNDDNEIYIFYNNTLPKSIIREELAIQIGHILLGHDKYKNIIGKSADKLKEIIQLKESKEFMQNLLMPICILLKLKYFQNK